MQSSGNMEDNTKSGKVVFKDYNQNQLSLLPPSLEELIPDNHLVRVVNRVIEQLDIHQLIEPYKGGGASNYHPRLMLKILVYGYCTKIYSCRRIAKSLQENIHFMWLAAQQTPDFRTINNFRSGEMKSLIETVFGQVLEMLINEEYIRMDEYFIDGTKLRADARKYSHVWAKNTKRYKGNLQNKLNQLYKEIDQVNEEEDQFYGDKNLEEFGQESNLTSQDVDKKAQELNEEIARQQQEKNSSSKKLRKQGSQVKKLKEGRDKLAKYEKQEELLNGRNSYSKTDPDATFMRMKNGELLPGYNILQGTENQFIVNTSIHQQASETTAFPSHFDLLYQNLEQLPQNIIGDAAYGSEENYDLLSKNNIGNYLKYSGINHEKSQKYRNNPFHKDNMIYDGEQDAFICPDNRFIKFKQQTTKKNKNGYQSQIREYESEDCTGCLMADACKKGKNNRQIKYSPGYEAYKEQVRTNLRSEKGDKLKRKRGPDVETPFGDIKHNMKFRRFSLRGFDKVKAEWSLVSIAHNIRKMQMKKVA